MRPRPAPTDRTLDLPVNPVTQIEQLVRPGRQRLAAEGTRLVHAFLAQLLHAGLAVLVSTRKLFAAEGGAREVFR